MMLEDEHILGSVSIWCNPMDDVTSVSCNDEVEWIC